MNRLFMERKEDIARIAKNSKRIKVGETGSEGSPCKLGKKKPEEMLEDS